MSRRARPRLGPQTAQRDAGPPVELAVTVENEINRDRSSVLGANGVCPPYRAAIVGRREIQLHVAAFIVPGKPRMSAPLGVTRFMFAVSLSDPITVSSRTVPSARALCHLDTIPMTFSDDRPKQVCCECVASSIRKWILPGGSTRPPLTHSRRSQQRRRTAPFGR